MSRPRDMGTSAAVAAVGAVFAVPFLLMVSVSFRHSAEAVADPLNPLGGGLTFDNYRRVWRETPVLRYYANSIVTTALIVVLQTVIAVAVALRTLMQDAGKTLDDSVQIVRMGTLFVEGSTKDVVMQLHERSSKARQACLAHYGYNCFVCGENLRLRYSGLPMELIHIHHEIPLSSVVGANTVDPINDMKPLCPNCHAVAHARSTPYSVAELKRMLSGEA